jgi:NhaA family Na+:H+ antiporter
MAYPPAPGILLFIAAVLSVIMVNSPLSGLYDVFLEIPVVVQAGTFIINKPLLLWINDGLMAVFFLFVGLEVKRELLTGHLSSSDKFMLPAIAALGGIVAPALLFWYVNQDHPEYLNGWAIPAATDIAFALGIIMLLGTRVAVALKVTLVAVAILDDLAAIIIIAVFYTANLSYISLIAASIAIVLLVTLNKCKVTSLVPYILIGIVLWASVLKSGVHATLAGVILGLCIPHTRNSESSEDTKQEHKNESPLEYLEHSLQPWVAFFVLPIFAFANAGVPLAGMSLDSLFYPVTFGIILGLFIGKQAGVMALSYIAVKLKICKLPEGVTWPMYYGMAVLTGIGFTMSFFIGSLAFDTQENMAAVRLGILVASAMSGILGYSVLWALTHNKGEAKPTASQSNTE